jgi:hypothetical protein
LADREKIRFAAKLILIVCLATIVVTLAVEGVQRFVLHKTHTKSNPGIHTGAIVSVVMVVLMSRRKRRKPDGS